MKIPELPPGSHRRAGRTDNGSRWYPNNDIGDIPGAFCVRSPSRSWPNSYINHFYSKKFARILAVHSPRRYFDLSGIDPQSETGKQIIAEHAKKRMEGNNGK